MSLSTGRRTGRAHTQTRSNTAAKAAAPVVISTSFLETIRRDATAPVAALTGTKPLISTASASSLARTHRDVIRERDSRTHKLEAARLATDSAAVHKEQLMAEERRMRVQEEARPILRKVREARVEEMDEVQELNHKAAKAQVLDTWAKQQALKAAREKDERDRAAMYDSLAAEKDRELLTAAQRQEDERRRREAEGAQVLAAQLAERAFARELHAEAVELEGAQLRRQAEMRVYAEEQARREAEAAGRKRREELAAANHAAAQRRAEREAQERAADEAALLYMVEKARLEEARMLAAEAEKKEKERVWKEMLARQQRDIDRRGEEDERRARAAQEAVVYSQRARAKAEEEKREALMKRVLEERAVQLELKRRAKLEAEQRELDYLVAAHERDVAAAMREIEEKKRKEAARGDYTSELVSQIADREDARRRATETTYQARLELQREEIRRSRAIDEARARKVEELRRDGVSDAAIRAAGIIP